MRICFLLLSALLAVGLLLDDRSLAGAQVEPAARLTDDDLWIVSTRKLPSPYRRDAECLEPEYWRRVNCKWRPASPEEFRRTTDPHRITCVYVHGNRIEVDEVAGGGMEVYRRLGCPSGAMRFVIWSWPSKKIRGVLRDARQKALRADAESYYLATALSKLPDDATVSLIGYSFGGRVVTGSLHLLGGGQLCGQALNPERIPAFRPRVALVAGAISHCWLCPQGAHGMAISKIDRMYSTFNPRDPALKRYHVTSKTSQPQALGYRGISSRCLGARKDLVCQHNVCGLVGRSHAFDRHFNSRAITKRIRQYVLWDEIR